MVCTCNAVDCGPGAGHESYCGQGEPDYGNVDSGEGDQIDTWDCGSGVCDPNTGCPSCLILHEIKVTA